MYCHRGEVLPVSSTSIGVERTRPPESRQTRVAYSVTEMICARGTVHVRRRPRTTTSSDLTSTAIRYPRTPSTTHAIIQATANVSPTVLGNVATIGIANSGPQATRTTAVTTRPEMCWRSTNTERLLSIRLDG